jgi:hypothetical protein
MGRPCLLVDDGREVGKGDGTLVLQTKFGGGPCQAWALLVSLSEAVWAANIAIFDITTSRTPSRRTNNTAHTHSQWVTQPVSARVRAMRTLIITTMGMRRLLTMRQLLEGLQEEGNDPSVHLPQAVQGR